MIFMSRNSIVRPAIATMSLHRLPCTDQDTQITCSQAFSCSDYSRYKYGSSRIGEAYASELVNAFWQRFPELALSRRLLISSPAYKAIPTSAFCIAQAFWMLVNQRRNEAGIPASHLIKIERTTLYPGDYGTLAAEQRVQVMGRNSLHVESALLATADLVIVDDSKVTGAHQQCIERHMEPLTLNTLTFLYVIECINMGAGDARIEDRLNHASVGTLMAVANIIHASDFLLNVRVCKYILSEENRLALPAFLEQMTDSFLICLYQNVLEDGYGAMDVYRESFQMLYDVLQQRRLVL